MSTGAAIGCALISMTKPVLSAHELHHTYQTSDGKTVSAIEGVSLHLPPNSFTCLIGPSGCGKSTLLRVLGGLLKPSSGQVIFDGKSLTRPQRRISIVFQQDNLMPWRTVYHNIVLPLQLAGLNRLERYQRAERMLQITGLKGFEDVYPAELSGGMAQRVTIARGLITNPDILLLDEPFGALDALTREQMWHELLTIWHQAEAAVLMVTHSIREAVFLGDRVLVMSSRPGHLLANIPITFERPRTFELLTDPNFAQLEQQVRNSLHL